MAQAIVDTTILDWNIAEVCEKLTQLPKRERDIKTNARTYVDIVEKDNLLRRIRLERRDLNRQLAKLSVQRSLIENNVGEEHEHDTDDQDEQEDAEEVEAADTQDLDDDRIDEYNRLNASTLAKGISKLRKNLGVQCPQMGMYFRERNRY